ncbi:hypothetical protein [Methylobacterium sp. Leaf465]|uniref:hypothetical protein n=1 Tax=Methylobacterium sp. Leaf465 TaxID=1736385 RepID=UPI0012E3E37A|nr:hypothetical protein [Methylobacterium sp. Leaf465]
MQAHEHRLVLSQASLRDLFAEPEPRVDATVRSADAVPEIRGPRRRVQDARPVRIKDQNRRLRIAQAGAEARIIRASTQSRLNRPVVIPARP